MQETSHSKQQIAIKLNISSGLCNRLRTIFYFHNRLEINQELVVVWNWNEKGTPGEFYDFFEQIPNLKFVRKTKLPIEYRGNGNDLVFDNNYDLLCPKNLVASRLRNEMEKLKNNYVAVHVRQTDIKLAYAKRNLEFSPSDLSVFFNFIDSHPNRNLYIASDNQHAYQVLFQQYCRHRIVNDNIMFLDTAARRKTSLMDAIVDLYMCIGAQEFQGTHLSSFTTFIEDNRKL